MKKVIKKIKRVFSATASLLTSFAVFSVLLFLYSLENFFFSKTYKIPIIPRALRVSIHLGFQNFYNKVCTVIDKRKPGTMTQIDLLELSLKNLAFKKTRTMITLGGVSIGFGAIVFLVSLGYGTQNLVISRVARLDELRQADLSPQLGSKNKLNDKILSDIKNFTGVEKVLPIISVVGTITYKDSVSDVPVYGVTTDYLTDSALQPTEGKIFDSNLLTEKIDSSLNTPQVAGISVKKTTQDYLVQFNFYPNVWARVREGPSTESNIIGLTKRGDGSLYGTEVQGGTYDYLNETNNKWITSNFDIYVKNTEGIYEKAENKTGYVALTSLVVEERLAQNTEVLGLTNESTASAVPSGTTGTAEFTIIESDNPDFVTIPEVVTEVKENPYKEVSLSSQALKQAVVNTATLNLLGLESSKATGIIIDVSYTATSGVLDDSNQKIQSLKEPYQIVAVIPDDKSPLMYVPFTDLKSMGLTNYSQARLYAQKKESLPEIRKKVEALGFNTRSASDTVQRIITLFTTLRLILGIMGTVALVVASLGMFNTFTVSLLERTREVGLMKAMGMKSTEVQKLFLTEAMIMGFSGGALGIVVGFIIGKLLDVILSSLSLVKGQGTISITHIPFTFVLLICFLSLLVGILTGIYPSTRAKKISALNALRYE